VGKRIHRSAAPALLLRNEAVFQSRLVTASAVFAIFFLLLAQKKEIKKRAGEIPACRQAGMRRLNSVEQVSLPISPFTTELPRALSVDHNARRRDRFD